jgi:hypothetical protein
MRNFATIASAALLSSALTVSLAVAQTAKCEGNKCPLPENLTEGMGGAPKAGAQVEGGAQVQGGVQAQGQTQTEGGTQLKQPGGSGEAAGQASGETDKTQSGAQSGAVAKAPAVTTEQKAEIKSSIRDLDVERIKINFNLNIGFVVPTRIELQPIPVRIVQLLPAYRGYLFFVTADGTIVIVAPDTRKIVYVIV